MEHSLRPKLYSLSPMEQEELKKFINESLKKGFIQESKLHMASPFFFIKKKNRKLRPVMDYRKLNEIMIKNKYPLPIIQELLDLLTEAEYFSLVDIDMGYNNVLIDEKDVHKATFHLAPSKPTHRELCQINRIIPSLMKHWIRLKALIILPSLLLIKDSLLIESFAGIHPK
ncbi:hypothetical protein HETIRDRAFT_455116 [Heterobasidion irregulare TC 32-1]|uniref:Reverse transcriptase domain-containing protein n=1 Tax=Heterobasidion irregulare (strain TC 32-1) TaxID=747525 RepID=W4JUM6_HETIT|nr:uncharacterized protein HETIRDRAFT_455116 [Heterobasidion irregulare TC 32-1]ETW76591.1 hypothetical protein HETIRDRAFT_455116 [Heterobasidion irregulare TC 32-1]